MKYRTSHSKSDSGSIKPRFVSVLAVQRAETCLIDSVRDARRLLIIYLHLEE